MGQEVRCCQGHTGLDQDGELDKAREAAVAVAERVDPGEVKMREGRSKEGAVEPGDRVRVIVRWAKLVAVDPVAQQFDQEVAVLGGCPSVAAHDRAVRADSSGDDSFGELGPFEDLAVEPFEQFRREHQALAFEDEASCQFVESADDVVGLLLQELLAWGHLEVPSHGTRDLLLGQRVALDCRRRPSPLRDRSLVQLGGELGLERRARDMHALGLGRAHMKPECGLEGADRRAEVDPRVRFQELPSAALGFGFDRLWHTVSLARRPYLVYFCPPDCHRC